MEAQSTYKNQSTAQFSPEQRMAINAVKQHSGYITKSLARFDSLKQDSATELSSSMNGFSQKRRSAELEQAMKTVRAFDFHSN